MLVNRSIRTVVAACCSAMESYIGVRWTFMNAIMWINEINVQNMRLQLYHRHKFLAKSRNKITHNYYNCKSKQYSHDKILTLKYLCSELKLFGMLKTFNGKHTSF